MKMYKLVVLLVFLAVNGASANPKGVIVYKSHPDGSDDLAIVAEYSSYEKFSRVVNYLPANGGALVRTNATGFIAAVDYPVLQTATITTSGQIALFDKIIAQLNQILSKYPLARGVVDDDLSRLKTAQQMFAQGNVLVAGNWKVKAEYEASIKENNKTLQELSVEGRSYKNLKLTSIIGSSIKFMHSGGVGSVDVKQLTDEQIGQLNSTSTELAIKRGDIMAEADLSTTDKTMNPPGEPTDKTWVAARFRGASHEFKGWNFGDTKQDLTNQIEGLSEQEQEESKLGITVLKGSYYGARISLYLKDDSLVSVDMIWEDYDSPRAQKKYSDFLNTIGANATSNLVNLTERQKIEGIICDVNFLECCGILSYHTAEWRGSDWFIVSLFSKNYIEKEFAPIIQDFASTVTREGRKLTSNDTIQVRNNSEEESYKLLSPGYERIAGYRPAISDLISSFSVGAFSHYFPPSSQVVARAHRYGMEREFTWEDAKGNNVSVLGTTTTLRRAEDGFWGRDDEKPEDTLTTERMGQNHFANNHTTPGTSNNGQILGFPLPMLGEELQDYRARAGAVELEVLNNYKGFSAKVAPKGSEFGITMSVFLRKSISSNREGGNEISLIHFETYGAHGLEKKALSDLLVNELCNELKRSYPDRIEWEIRREASDEKNIVDESFENGESYMSFIRLNQMKRVQSPSFGEMDLPINAQLYFFDDDGFKYYKSCDGQIHQ